MKPIHQNLADGRWLELTLSEQMANIGSEFGRLVYWLKKNDAKNGQSSLARVLDLISLTISDKRNFFRLRELTRLRELISAQVESAGKDKSLPWLQSYFLNYALKARR